MSKSLLSGWGSWSCCPNLEIIMHLHLESRSLFVVMTKSLGEKYYLCPPPFYSPLLCMQFIIIIYLGHFALFQHGRGPVSGHFHSSVLFSSWGRGHSVLVGGTTGCTLGDWFWILHQPWLISACFAENITRRERVNCPCQLLEEDSFLHSIYLGSDSV